MKRTISLFVVVGIILLVFSPLALAQDSAYQEGFRDGVQAGESDVRTAGQVIEASWGFSAGAVFNFSLTDDGDCLSRPLGGGS